MTKKQSPRIPISLSDQDRKHLQILADMQGVSLSEAARRAVLDAYERTQEAEVRPRIEDPLLARLEHQAAKLSQLESLLHGAALRLLALINCSKGRHEIEAELKRLVQP